MGLFNFFKKNQALYSESKLKDVFVFTNGAEWKDLQTGINYKIKNIEAYEYGKTIYQEKYGNPIGQSIIDIFKNQQSIFLTHSVGEEVEINDSIIQQDFILLGKHYWEKDLILKNNLLPYWRNEEGLNSNLISDFELKNWLCEYRGEYHLFNNHKTNYSELVKRKRVITKYINEVKSLYNSQTKEWKDFDISHVFLQTRSFMISKNIPNYIWNITGGNPFYKLYSQIYKYVKYKKSFRLTKQFFEEICKWEQGKIFKENESHSKIEKPLWIGWNNIGKNLLSCKSYIKKEENGIDWLKNEVGEYIKSRIDFYNNFGEQNEHRISNELIQKIDVL